MPRKRTTTGGTRDLWHEDYSRRTPAPPPRKCERCGADLCSRNPGLVCWCHKRLRPQHARDFDPELLALLRAHPGQRVDPVRYFNIEADDRFAVSESVKRLRRRGHVIAGFPSIGGYLYMSGPGE